MSEVECNVQGTLWAVGENAVDIKQGLAKLKGDGASWIRVESL
jgi:hypothetical protein